MKRTYYNSYFLIPGLLLAACFGFIMANAQDISKYSGTNGTIQIAAHPEYDKAGGIKRLFLGEHYRKEWAMPVNIEIINLDTVAGGLTASKMGGGMQTKSLRLEGQNGKEYVLRSVNKDPEKLLPAELVGTFASDVLQDQISSSNPYAPLAVSALADAAGIYHTTPKIVFVPESARLGEFGKQFANTLCLFEERPSGNEKDNQAFGFSENIVNSEKLFFKLMTDHDQKVDLIAYLKARLFDMWIGDWDRHPDQWLWAGFKTGDNTIYRPIPRDRDQAFAKLDGIIPHMATQPWAIRQMQSFDYTIKDVKGINMTGSILDRMFSTQLTLEDWLAVTHELQSNLTNHVIESAFDKMPKEVAEISSETVKAKLKKRRDDLEQYATEYYKFLLKEVNIIGTQKKEIIEINRKNDQFTEVAIYESAKAKNAGKSSYKRSFSTSETKEIRIYGLGGDDHITVWGNVDQGTLIRIIGGKGKDTIVDSSVVTGMGRKTRIYDDKNNDIDAGSEGSKYISSDSLKNDFNPKAIKYDWLGFRPSFGYNPDDGVFVGAGVTFKKQKFGKAPFGYMQSLWGNYAFSTGAYNFGYEGIFKEAVGHWDLLLNAKINAPNFIRNFYGMGNETEIEHTEKNYYRVRMNQYEFNPSLAKHFGKRSIIEAGVLYQSTRGEKTADRFVSESSSNLDSSDFGRKHYGSVFMKYQYSSLDNPLYPRKGFRVRLGAAYFNNLKEKGNFASFSYEQSFFISTGRLTAASRIGASTNVGDDYEFYQANTLGGTTNLRGYGRDRFSGKTSLYSNTELRLKLSKVNGYLLRGQYGLLGFVDNGRVWIPGEESKEWHWGYGGGIWFLPYNRLAFTATYGISNEDKIVNLKAGFIF